MKSRNTALTTCLILAACGTEPSAPSEPAAPAVILERADVASTAGFASVDITWRAGAKPGQVGTDADLVGAGKLWAGIIRVATTAERLQYRDKPVQLAQYATRWTLRWLHQRVADMPYDEYTEVSQPGRGIHTHSYAKALVVERGGQKVALVRADLYLMQHTIHHRVAELVAAQTGIPAENIIISATHNHSAADAAHTAAGIATLSEAFDARHFVWLTRKIADAIIEADASRVPAAMSAVRTKLRASQRNIIGPATGEAVPPGGTEPVPVYAGYPRDYFDDDLFVVDFNAEQTGERLGALIVFGMHPESLDDGHGMLSSDFPGLTELGLEERWGAPVMWMPGGGLGDIEPDDGTNFGEDFWREDFATLDEHAAVLVDAIAPVLEEGPLPDDQVILPTSTFAVNARSRLVPGPPNAASPTDTAWQWPVTTYLGEPLPLACARVLAETANLYLSALQVGGLVFLGAPAEITTDLSRHIRSRVNAVEGDVWQGYLWAENPDWVDDRVAANFTPGEMSAAEGFAMPVVISQSNDYTGYVVTRWEFENRYHYRMSMTLFGPDTADYIATRLEGLARELRGQPPLAESWDRISEADPAMVQLIDDYVGSLEPTVAAWAASIPFQDPWDVGLILREPTLTSVDEMGAPSWGISWVGSTSDLGNPTVRIERRDAAGMWTEVLDDVSPHLWLMYQKGGRWDAIWHLVDAPAPGTYRFRVSGVYRGITAGVSAVDPIWDPAGQNVPYEVVSRSFTI